MSRIIAFSEDERESAADTGACNAGFNMLRVWGGGLYESEDFYELCDAHGILVWQDFPYACAYYPDTGEYAEAARVEATAAVRRIRNHPSLALWCGNNENQMMYDGNWGGARPALPGREPVPRRPARRGRRRGPEDALLAVVALRRRRPGDANSADYGDCHNWDVWHGRGDWAHYTENDARFCSEFGFAASCGLRRLGHRAGARGPAPAVARGALARQDAQGLRHLSRLHRPALPGPADAGRPGVLQPDSTRPRR